jgi:lipid A 3-O-deacylase
MCRRALMVISLVVASAAVDRCPAAAQPLLCPEQGHLVGFYFENDTRWLTRTNQSDDDYTAAFRLYRDQPVGALSQTPWYTRLWFRPGANRCFAREIGFGSSIYTPTDTQSTVLLTDQRPYAGWTYGYYGVAAHDFDKRTRPRRMQSLEIYLGVLGPGAGGKFIQNTFHRITLVERADGYIRVSEGWHNQIKNEPALLGIYRQRRRLTSWERDGRKWGDTALTFNGALGNVFTHAEGGLMLRLGYNIANDLGPVERITSVMKAAAPDRESGPVPEGRFEIYGFVQGGGRLVGHNFSLDGNLFRETPHHVTKKHGFGEVEAGAVVRVDWFRVTWRTVVRSAEFDEQDRTQKFGSLTVSVSRGLR